MTARTDAILAQEFSGLPDWQVADTLNAETVQVDGDSPIVVVQNFLLMTGQWGRMKDDAAKSTDATNRIFCQNALCLFEDPKIDSLGWGDNPAYPAAIAAILDGMIAYGYLDAAGKTFVMNQRYVPAPKWVPKITYHEVGEVRKAQ